MTANLAPVRVLLRRHEYRWTAEAHLRAGCHYSAQGATADEAERRLHAQLADAQFRVYPDGLLDLLAEWATRWGVPIIRREREPWEAPGYYAIGGRGGVRA